MRFVALILAVAVAKPVNAQLVVSGGGQRSIVMSGVSPASQSVASVPPTGTDADKPAQPIEYTSNDPAEQPSSKAVADLGMSLLELSSSDLLAEIGCGNAQHLIRAVKRYGCRGLGVEINVQLADAAQAAVDAAGLSDRIDILHCDAKFIDFSDVDAVYLYHFPEQLEWIAPKVAGKRVASAFHELPGWSGRKVGDVWVYGVTANETRFATQDGPLPPGWRVDFWTADWCSVCREIKPGIVSELGPQVTIRDPEDPAMRPTVDRYNIASLPVLQIVDSNNNVKTTIRGRTNASYLIQRASELSGDHPSQTIVQPREQSFNVAVWNGQQYYAPVCNSSNCQMCNSIRRQLGGR